MKMMIASANVVLISGKDNREIKPRYCSNLDIITFLFQGKQRRPS
jgi:hypothetical protein